MIKKETIVTGAAGFIGATLVKLLLKDGYAVHAIVRKGGNLWRLKDIGNKIIIHDVGLDDLKRMKRLFKKIGPYAIFHLATYGSYPFQQDTRMMIDTNITGTWNLLECLKDVEYKQLVVAGSSSEYGKKDGPMKESDLLTPNNYYAVTKAAQTHLCQVFAKSNHKPLLIFRLFNVYGPYEEKGRLVRSVIESVLRNKPVLLASGREARDFIYVEDVVDAFMHALKKKQFIGEIFNIGTGAQTTVGQLAEIVVGISGKKTPIRFNAYEGRPWDTLHWSADTSKTREVLGWNYKISPEEGIKKTIDWYKNKA